MSRRPLYDDGTRLWPARCLTDGRLVITRGSARRPRTDGPGAVQRFGRYWRRLRRWQQWVIALVVASLAGGPFRDISEDLAEAISLAVLVAIGVLVMASRDSPPSPAPRPTPPEVFLAAADTTEARVAAAASRAWLETVREPAWQSPHLAHGRAAFDGQAEVDQIIDLALRIYQTRLRLGHRPGGPAAEYWERQHQALEQAAHRLGERADALIRFRDQAAQLSTELQHLADLEHLESTALEIQDLTRQTAATGQDRRDMATVADEIAGVRAAMSELVDLMTRTLTPLQSPPPPPPGLRH